MRSLFPLYRSLFWLSSLVTSPSRRLGKRFLPPILSVLVLFCPSLAGVASAGVNTWTTSGPDGGPIYALAIHPATPATLYAGTHSRRRLQEHQRRGELERHQHRPEHPLYCLCPGHRSFNPGHALCRDWDDKCMEAAAASSRAPTAGESWTAINAGLTSTICLCPGHRSFRTGHAVRQHVFRRRLQEHQRRGELERHQHRPEYPFHSLSSLHRSFCAGHALCREWV